MAFRHGVYKSEVPTSIISPSQGYAGLPFIVGTAPVFMGDRTCVNKTKLVYTYEEAVSIFGYSDDWESWTLCEFIYAYFALYNRSPAVLVNVFDPAKHKEEVSGAEYTSSSGSINLGQNVISADNQTLYYDDEGNARISSSGTVNISRIVKAKPSLVTASDIIGGVNAQTGGKSGLELINNVFPKFRVIPGLIGCPKYSELPEVAAVMRAKSENINGLFTCMSVVDIPSDSGGPEVYTDVPEWKNQHSYTSEREIVCWPKAALGGKVYHLSTQVIGLMSKVDSERGDIPYKSPSNELLQIDSGQTGGRYETWLTFEQANYLNSQGIMTALNWIGGWRAWGNRTGAYPASTDVKDVFIPVRRMMDYLGNTFITTFWQKVDQPMSPRLIRTIVNSFNMYINSLVAIEALLGGRVEFREDENAYTDLMNGILKFHVLMTPPVPAEVIEGIFEYDPEYLSTLYEAL
ncbi:MAG: phage tail sheath family protein [Synergistaceae bacterium]|nr:phage tail sheath family protein [Synergistaceae bacterium]